MVADHDEQHGQGKVIVMHAALLGLLAVLRIGQLASGHGFDHLALAGNDQHQHIGHHDGADHGAHVDVGGASAEQMREHVRGADDQREHRHAEPQFILRQLRAAQQVVHGPADDEGGDADADGLAAGNVGHGFVDHHGLGVEIVGNGQERKTGQPGRIRFPLEPVQFLRQFGGRHQVFLRVVETAAMHGPQFARHALLLQLGAGCGRSDRVVEPDEIKGSTDPGDARDDVQPADDQVQPLQAVRDQVGKYFHKFPLVRPNQYSCQSTQDKRIYRPSHEKYRIFDIFESIYNRAAATCPACRNTSTCT